VNACVVIPWWPKTDDEWRIRWRDEVTALWVGRGFEVLMGAGVEGTARNAGVQEAIAEDYDTILVCDADSIITEQAAWDAVRMAAIEPGLVIPHDRYVYLSEKESDLSGADGAATVLERNEGRWPTVTNGIEFHGGLGVGGPSAFSVETWAAAGGYDDDIVRAYDGAFALACGILVAPQRRLHGDYVHLWHPRPAEEPATTWELMNRYHLAAEQGKDAMRKLVEARRRGA
jgi:hypothetical protein